jgi:hypothetical protein
MHFIETLDKNEKFKVVVIQHVLEHIQLEKYVIWLQQIKEHLEPDGYFLVVVPNVNTPFSMNAFGDITHINMFTWASLHQLLWLGGYSNIQHKNDIVCADSLKGQLGLVFRLVIFYTVYWLWALYNGVGNRKGIFLDRQLIAVCR